MGGIDLRSMNYSIRWLEWIRDTDEEVIFKYRQLLPSTHCQYLFIPAHSALLLLLFFHLSCQRNQLIKHKRRRGREVER